MGVIWKSKKEKMLEKQINLLYERMITNENQLNQALYGFISQGQGLTKDSKLKDYVRKGYEGNPDVFGILLRIANKFTLPKYRIVKVQSNGKYVDIQLPEFEKLLKRPNFYQNWNEFKRAYILFKLVTGNSIVYAPKYETGINKGKINQNGLSMMPTQNVTIFTGGERKPIDHYRLDLNEQYHIKPTDVWHERMPSLWLENGDNFMGISPLKVALHTINSLNAGAELTSNMYKGGHPPGILSKETDGLDTSTPKEQEQAFREHYKRKYINSPEDQQIPVFTFGKVNFTQIGYNSIRDLQVIEMAQHGKRVLCNVLQVDAKLFGDVAASTYDNMDQAAAAMWEDLLIPECDSFYEGITEEILPAYGDGLKIIPVYDHIRVLQEDRERMAKIYQIGVGIGAYSPNEFREKLGDEPVKDEAMDRRYIPGNMFPIDEENELSIEESDKFYEQNNLKDKL